MSLPYPDDVIAWIVIYHDKHTAWGEAPRVLREAYNAIKQVCVGVRVDWRKSLYYCF